MNGVIEWRNAATNILNRAAHVGDVALVNFAEENQRHMQVVRFDPFDALRESGHLFLDAGQAVSTELADLDGDEGTVVHGMLARPLGRENEITRPKSRANNIVDAR